MSYNLLVWLAASPFNPYWLNNYKMRRGNDQVLRGLGGEVLEVGAGDGARKTELTRRYPKITKYIATDFSSWDGQFSRIDRLIKRWGRLGETLLGFKKRIDLDVVCSATDLPYKDDTFDWHLSFETLEHISDPWAYFIEATRVVKRGGFIALSVPFLYRVHGGEPEHKLDFYRFADGFFHEVAQKNSLEVVALYRNTGAGTSLATLFNAWLVKIIFESFFLIRGVTLLISPFIFFLTNIFGLMIDISPDRRFSTRYHVLLRKTGN